MLGTSIASIVATEDRAIFKTHVEAVGEKVSKGDVATTMGGALAVARSIGYVYWGERAEERAEERTSQREKECVCVCVRERKGGRWIETNQ